MSKLRYISVLIIVIFHLNGKGQEGNDLPKGDPNKSWGLGLNYNTWDNSYGFGFSMFYANDRNQYELDLYSTYELSGFALKYFYYPNQWKKRMDMRVESGISLLFSKHAWYGNAVTPFAGYGLRFLVLRHFYFTHSACLGLRYRNYSGIYEGQVRYDGIANINFGFMINLGSFKWRKK